MLIEQVLPARFGGTPLDYQLMEQEEEYGLTRVYLVIHPALKLRTSNRSLRLFYILSAMHHPRRMLLAPHGSKRGDRESSAWNRSGAHAVS